MDNHVASFNAEMTGEHRARLTAVENDVKELRAKVDPIPVALATITGQLAAIDAKVNQFAGTARWGLDKVVGPLLSVLITAGVMYLLLRAH